MLALFGPFAANTYLGVLIESALGVSGDDAVAPFLQQFKDALDPPEVEAAPEPAPPAPLPPPSPPPEGDNTRTTYNPFAKSENTTTIIIK